MSEGHCPTDRRAPSYRSLHRSPGQRQPPRNRRPGELAQSNNWQQHDMTAAVWRGAYRISGQDGAAECFTSVSWRGIQIQVLGLPSLRAAAILADVAQLWCSLASVHRPGLAGRHVPDLNFSRAHFRPLLLHINACETAAALAALCTHLRDSPLLSVLCAATEYEELVQRHGQHHQQWQPQQQQEWQQEPVMHNAPQLLSGLSSQVGSMQWPLAPRLAALGQQQAAQSAAQAAAVAGSAGIYLPYSWQPVSVGQAPVHRLPSLLSTSWPQQAPQHGQGPCQALQQPVGQPVQQPVQQQQQSQLGRHRLSRTSSAQENMHAMLASEEQLGQQHPTPAPPTVHRLLQRKQPKASQGTALQALEPSGQGSPHEQQPPWSPGMRSSAPSHEQAGEHSFAATAVCVCL